MIIRISKKIIAYILFSCSFLFGFNNEDKYVILVSFDGFRYDYDKRVDTPYFDYLKDWGVKAKSLKPVFPSFTFPNHYSIATGCYADKHKIIGNEFVNDLGQYSYKDKTTVQDSKWYGAEPIWVTAEKKDIITATYFWVGSEAPIGGYYPTYYKNYKNGVDPIDKVDQVVDWLELPISERPRLICLYFNEPDHAGHVFGASSDEVNDKIRESDYILGYLLRSLSKLDIYKNIDLVVVSDHGMVDVSKDKTINIDNYNIPGIVDGKGPIMNILSDNKSIIDLVIPNTTIVSAKLNYDLHYDSSMYDFLLIADEGWMMYLDEDLKEYDGEIPVKGMHGYHSDSINMHAIFYAFGPSFKKSLQIDTFELIHIYPMICKLLEITPYENIDGDLEILKPILK